MLQEFKSFIFLHDGTGYFEVLPLEVPGGTVAQSTGYKVFDPQISIRGVFGHSEPNDK